MDMETYRDSYAQSIKNPDQFWAEKAELYIDWIKKWDTVLTGDFQHANVEWFKGAELNAAFNCLDRHLPKKRDQIAIIFEGDDPRETTRLTYQQLFEAVCRFANVLKMQGIKTGDRVCIYLPMIPEAVIAMLACARIGAVHSVVFGGFSAESLKSRILDADCRLVITATNTKRGGKMIPLKENVDKALTGCPDVRSVIVCQRSDNPINWVDQRDHWYHELMAKASLQCTPAVMCANDPLFILYTSGSTGKPKGVLHGTGGYLVYAALTYKIVFDYRDGEIYWCTADVGWITGHTYGVYGPLLNGATIVMYEGIPNYPDPSRWWEMVDRHQVNIFYTAPTAIRALRREGDRFVTSTSRQSLRILGTVGEPINPEAWEWYYQIVGETRCPIVDTWWQTETGGIMITPIPGATLLKPGFASWPFFGVEANIVDDEGKVVSDGTMGRLIITKPWPGMMQTIYGDHDRFVKTYFNEVPGVYLTGDLAFKDQDGNFCIEGRSDDVIKVSGHRIGTQEVESAIVSHPAVSEAAVVAKSDPIKGQVIYAFVTLKAGSQETDQLKKELIQTVREKIGPIASPNHIQWADGLPKTRSGKIMRRILRKIANHETETLGDLTTLADPSVVETLMKNAE